MFVIGVCHSAYKDEDKWELDQQWSMVGEMQKASRIQRVILHYTLLSILSRYNKDDLL